MLISFKTYQKAFVGVFVCSWVICAIAQEARAVPGIEPRHVTATYTKIYVPEGYDSNDLVQITGEGRFRNTCYRHAETSVQIDKVNRIISLGPVAYEYAGLCLQVILPFQRVVDIGLLSAGIWEVQQGAAQKLGSFTVKPAITNAADDFVYVPVTQASFDATSAIPGVTLSGEFSNDCMSYDREITTVQQDVIVIQPIAKFETGPHCTEGKFLFSKKISLTGVTAGRYLLHVRSLGGNALKSLIDIQN